MAGRSRSTSRPPFSCFKRSTKLRLRTRSQVMTGVGAVSGLLSGMHGLLRPARKRDRPLAFRVPFAKGARDVQTARVVRSGEADANGLARAGHTRPLQVQNTGRGADRGEMQRRFICE